MEEIALQIHYNGRDPHEITAPPDLETGEFIRELVAGLRLPNTEVGGQPIVWEVDDKETGQKLIAGRTLHESGVCAGHHLYLNRRATHFSAPVVEKGQVSNGVAPHSPRWPLIVALACIPVAAVGSYVWTRGQSSKLQLEMGNSQAATKAANELAAAARDHAAQLAQKLAELQEKNKNTDSEITRLRTEAAAEQAQLAAKDRQISRLTQDLNQLRAGSAARDQDQTTRLAASAQQVQALQSQLAAKQKEVATILPLQTQIAALERRLQSTPTRPNHGWLTWIGDIPKGNIVEIRDNKPTVGMLSGARLPGTACTVEPADPARVTIEAAPDLGTAWNRVVFRVTGKGMTTVRLLWVVR